MADSNLYPTDGVWDYCFQASEREGTPENTWALEFHDPKSFTQTIALYLNFESTEHAIWWFQMRMQARLAETYPQTYYGKVQSSWAGPVLELLWAISADEVPEHTPWYYGNRFGPAPAIIEVTESGGYTLYDPATGRVPEPDPDELEAMGVFDDDAPEGLDPNHAHYASVIGQTLRDYIQGHVDQTDGRFTEPEEVAAIEYAKAYLRDEFTLNANGIAAMLAPMLHMVA